MASDAPSPHSDAQLRNSASLLSSLRLELARYVPFAQMAPRDVAFFIAHATEACFAPGEVLAEPARGPVQSLYFIRQGVVGRDPGAAAQAPAGTHYDAGDLFPVRAAMAERAVTSTYRARADTVVLELPVAAMRALASQSAPFANFLQGRLNNFLELSARAVQAAHASQALAQQSLEQPLDALMVRAPLQCRADTPLRQALGTVQSRGVGSILITDTDGRLQGILTRHDILGRITLPGVPLERPIGDVMVQPVLSLSPQHTAQDAALLMSRHGVRHVPVVEDGRAVGIVSERDLFALQRLSLKGVSDALRNASDLAALEALAHDIRSFARGLLAQGVQARQLTALISHLNDLLTERLLVLLAQQHALDLKRVCWLALGSEGRSEQTVATDQDNALLLPDTTDAAERARWLALGRAANEALARCGYPLCKGGIMAGESACCLTLSEWRARFARWIDQGAPQDLLDASIYFDFRALAGDATLAQVLREEVGARARAVPRFLKQLALNALTRTPPLGWLGGVSADAQGRIDLKLQGTAIFVDAARLFALAQGEPATGTRERLQRAGAAMGVVGTEYDGWVGAFEYLQLLRLHQQFDTRDSAMDPNTVLLDELNDIDRRILRESLRQARALQQRLRLDYER